MNLEEAKAMIARVDAAEAAGILEDCSDEVMREYGYVLTEGGIWELPIPREIARQLVAEQDLDRLYARLDQTQPGSEESKSISREIIDAIGQDDPLVQRLKEWEATPRIRRRGCVAVSAAKCSRGTTAKSR
jgi:hypothetical protein